MANIKKIMVALGFTEYCQGIFTYAADLAKSFDADLLVVSVINDRDVQAVQTISSMGYNVNGEHYTDSIRDERKALLAQYRDETGLPEKRVKTVIRVGNPIDELLRAGVEEAVDLIVMGIKGRTDLESVFVGSVAEKMFRRSPITLVSYRDPVNAAKLRKRIHLKAN